MKIIAHRGASGLALENTIESIQAALELKVDAIECDVRRTKDHKLVILHDPNTGRVSDTKLNVKEHTLAELQKVKLHNGHHVPSLEQVLKLVNNQVPLVLDIKDGNLHHELLHLLEKYPDTEISLTGLQYEEMHVIFLKRSDISFFVQSHFSPIEIIQTAKKLQATGISLNMWLINPLTYFLARRNNLRIRVYTVNHPFMIRFLKILYPGIEVFTNHPHKYVRKHRRKTKRKAKTL